MGKITKTVQAKHKETMVSLFLYISATRIPRLRLSLTPLGAPPDDRC